MFHIRCEAADGKASIDSDIDAPSVSIGLIGIQVQRVLPRWHRGFARWKHYACCAAGIKPSEPSGLGSAKMLCGFLMPATNETHHPSVEAIYQHRQPTLLNIKLPSSTSVSTDQTTPESKNSWLNVLRFIFAIPAAAPKVLGSNCAARCGKDVGNFHHVAVPPSFGLLVCRGC